MVVLTRDRIIGLTLCIGSVVLMLSALQIRRVIPVGIAPGTFPLLLSGLLGLLGVVLILRPATEPEAASVLPGWRAVSGLALYAALAVLAYVAFRPLGFVLVGAICILAVGARLGARVSVLLPAAVVVPPLIHVLFVRVFSVPLPPGLLAGLLP